MQQVAKSRFSAMPALSSNRSFQRALETVGVQAGILLAVTLLCRIGRWGDPVIHVDEQFYLLVGDRMLHHALPYVDIWDRKPVGLFLIYAAIRLLGGDGILQYQIVASLFAFATALVITRIAMRIAPAGGALLGGIVYLIWLDVFGGEGGQSPVFYNLLVAGAGLITLHATAAPAGSSRRLTIVGAVALTLTGLAIQIKYTALFEGVFFGLTFMARAWQIAPRPLARVGEALAWVGCGLLPTALAYLVFARLGAGEAFVFANFTSVFQRVPSTGPELAARLVTILKYAWPLLLCAAFSLGRAHRADPASRSARMARLFVGVWTMAAIAGLLLFGTYFEHYFLPVLVPLTAACTPLLGRRRAGLDVVGGARTLHIPVAVLVPAFGIVSACVVLHKNRLAHGGAQDVALLVEAIRPRLTNCMFVYDGEPILYHLTGSCLPSRHAFPDHLNNRIEVGAVGIDQNAEVRRILAGKPNVVVTTDRPQEKTNRETWAIVTASLAQDYRRVLSVTIGHGSRDVYERKGPT